MTDANLFQIGSGWFPERKGGAENVFFHLFHGLGSQGFAVRGVVPGTDEVERQTKGLVQGFAVGATSSRQRAMAIRRSAFNSFSTARPDIVASHFAPYSLPLLDRVSHLPLITHFHGPWAMESLVEGAGIMAARVKKVIEKLVYRRARRIIVLSRAFGELLERQYGIPDSLIRFIPGGVECDRFDLPISRMVAREALGWDPDRPTIFVVRRLVKRMGLDRLLDAIAILRGSSTPGCRDLVLHIAGSGPERAALADRVAVLDLSDAVRFDGHLSDDQLPLAYRAADLTLVPTTELEGFGLVAIESLAAGTPVLVTPVGGLPEVVSGLSDAMVLKGIDARSIADGIGSALADASFLPSPEACRGYARRRFDWQIVTSQVAAVYREVL